MYDLADCNLEKTYVRQGDGLDTESVSGYGLRIRTLDPDYFQNLTGDFLVKGYICDKIFMKIRSLYPEI